MLALECVSDCNPATIRRGVPLGLIMGAPVLLRHRNKMSDRRSAASAAKVCRSFAWGMAGAYELD